LTSEYPYTGVYDHGAYFEPPSEYLLHTGDPRLVLTEYDDGTICINYPRDPKYRFPYWAYDVNLYLGYTNRTWRSQEIPFWTDKPGECEVYLNAKTGRILSERMEYLNGRTLYLITCTYEYGDGPFPTGFTTVQTSPPRPEDKLRYDYTDTTTAKCEVINGLWFITSYETISQARGGKAQPQLLVEIKDIKVTPLKSEWK
jgi:hypothetical protein